MDYTKWLSRFCLDLETKYGSENTHKSYLSCVSLFLNEFKHYDQPQRIPNDEIKQWLLQAKTFNTRKHRLCAINAFYRLTVGMPLKTGKIPFPPKEKKLPRIIDNESLKQKILAIENKKHKAILSIAYCCSLRVSEVVNLKISDIDGKQKIVSIMQSKGNKDRYIGISESCLNILRDYFKEYKPKEYLFEGQFGGKYSTRSCEEIYHKYIDKNTGFHLLRHSGITSMVEAGNNLLAIGVAVGHSNPKTTAVYYHVSPKFLQQIHTPI